MPLDLLDAAPAHPLDITGIWNAACGHSLSITNRLAGYILGSATGAVTASRLAKHEGQPAGFVVASATTQPVDGLVHPSGWIDALAVLPDARRRGVGGQLLSWAETWLRERGCPLARLGGGLRPIAPGLPGELDNAAFFLERGYTPRPQESQVWDVARRLDDYATPAWLPAQPADVRPLSSEDVGRLEAFLVAEFPGRWHFEFREHLRLGGRLEDILVLWSTHGIDGFCHLTLEDSLRPIDRFYPHSLPHPWGQLGPIGVRAARRGQGLGAALLDAGLRFLRERGVAGCVIDWTSQPGFFQRFGFRIHRNYLILIKELY